MIAGYRTKLGKALIQKYRKEEKTRLILPGSPLPSEEERLKTPDLFYEWNTRDSFAPRYILRQSLKEVSVLDQALVLIPPPEESPSFAQSNVLEIEEIIDSRYKACLLLLKTLSDYFHERQYGKLCLILEDGSRSAEWDAGLRAFLKEFWGSLLSRKENKALFWGMIPGRKSPETEAHFIYETLRGEKDSPGKWISGSELKQTLMKILKH